MTTSEKIRKSGWTVTGVSAAVLGLGAMAFSARGEADAGAYRATIPEVTLPAVKGVEVAKLGTAPYVPADIDRDYATKVVVDLPVIEKEMEIKDGLKYRFWTFGGTVPGKFIRVREGDEVELHLKNPAGNEMGHNIDLHAVTGPHGGGMATITMPGQENVLKFRAVKPGLYVYHCAMPGMVGMHIANGMYGMILVEPKGGLPKVDHEFYVMQGDFYTKDVEGHPGVEQFDHDKAVRETPDFVLFNGRVGSLLGDKAPQVKAGETVRIFFGVGGPNITSSFHVIGEIFDRVYPEGSSEPLTNVQTTLVPTGGATIVEFKAEVPGTYTLVDHSLGRLEKGAAGQIVVEGPENPAVFKVVQAGTAGGGGH
jgi:nitrite reductase (NO-forming)